MKKLVIMLAFMVFAGSLFAQESKPRWAHVGTNHFWDNWEVSVDAGLQSVMAIPNEKNGVKINPEGAFGKDFTFAFDVYATKWITPIIGLRTEFTGINFTNYYTDVKGASVKNETDYFAIHENVLFNLTNWICGYRQDRFFNASMYLGIGYARSDKKNDEWVLPVGILTTYRLNDAWSLNLDWKNMLLRNEFAVVETSASNQVDIADIMSLTFGVTYKFRNNTSENTYIPERGFAGFTPIDESQWVKKAAYDELQRELNDAKGDNDNYQKQLDKYKKALDAETKAKNDALAEAAKKQNIDINEDATLCIFFNLGSSVISDRNTENINFMAKLINSNKGRQYSVAGYADKETGSESINEVLSQKRAEAVRDALVKAGVSPDQIKVDYYGCRVQPFEGKGYLNRVAIIK